MDRANVSTIRVLRGVSTAFSDGWQGYRSMLLRAYRKLVLTGKRGHLPWAIPETVTLTQTVKQRDGHG